MTLDLTPIFSSRNIAYKTNVYKLFKIYIILSFFNPISLIE